MEWHDIWDVDKIKVFRLLGAYRLLEEPFCEVCGNPNTTSYDCVWHNDLYGFKRIYVMGKYLKSSVEDLLSDHILKLKKEKAYAEPLGIALALVVMNRYPELLNSDLIVPVPLHPKEFSERGYNQAYELANVVGRQLNIPVSYALIKTKPLKMHTRGKSLSRLERQKAVKGLYEPNKSQIGNIKGKRVILIDDVVTTGFTVSECSDVLVKSGAIEVNVLALARTVI